MIDTFQRVNGVSLKVIKGPARANEASESWADPALAHAVLGWKATRSLAQMCQDAWRWQCR
jgi:UDP-glucose 4-epimerase